MSTIKTGSLEILIDSKNAVKWCTQTFTVSISSKPRGEIWESVQQICQNVYHVKITFTNILEHSKPCHYFGKNATGYLITKYCYQTQ